MIDEAVDWRAAAGHCGDEGRDRVWRLRCMGWSGTAKKPQTKGCGQRVR
jgi:hypothetical protein